MIRAVLGWARRSGYTVCADAWAVRLPRVIKKVMLRFDPELIDRFLAAAGGRDRVILEVGALTGMRSDELKSFHTSWIRWHEDRIVVTHDETYSPKAHEARSIPLFKRLTAILTEWLGKRSEGLVFPPLRARSKHGQNRGVSLRKVFDRVRKAPGVNLQGMHDLRHHYLSLLAYGFAGHRDPGDRRPR